jgi:phosphatidate cytidylyltransferase
VSSESTTSSELAEARISARHEPILAPPSIGAQAITGFALGAAALGSFLAGRVFVSAFIAALCVLAYNDLRRLLADWGHIVTFVLGAGGVLGSLWSGYVGRLDLLSAAMAALVISLLLSRILLHEIQGRAEGVTQDVAATLGASGVVGVLGAHVLLIHEIDNFGFRGLMVFGLMVLLNDALAFFVGRWHGRHFLAASLSPNKTWEGTVSGFAASVAVGVVAGIVLDPPFDIASGIAFGAGMGVLAPVGDLVFSAIKRSAGARSSGRYLGPLGGALDAIDSVLFAAPAFYWAFRTIAL